MGIREKMAAKTATLGTTPQQKAKVASQAAPVTFMLQGERIKLLEQQIESLQESGRTAKRKINELVRVPGRQRKLTPEQRSELKENLTHNKLIHPVGVRLLPSGKREVVSGHNRIEIYEELGRDEIETVDLDLTELEAKMGALWANLFQPELPDFEKHISFVELMRESGLNQVELAELAGISKGHLSKIMNFGKLPPAAIELLRLHPHAIGAAAAFELMKLTDDGRGDKVVEAIRLVVEGSLTQDQAIKHAKTLDLPPSSKPALARINIMVGKTKYCEIIGVKNSLRLDFKSEAERERVTSLIEELLTKSSNS